jgi:membrane protein
MASYPAATADIQIPTRHPENADARAESPGGANLWQLARQSVTEWSNDYASSMGAALAYYTLFSLAPLLLLVISIAGLVFGADAARGQVVAQLGGLIGPEGATAVEGLLKSASEPAKSTIASLISLATLIIGATSIFAELQSDLDRICRAPEVAKPSGVWGLLRTRLLSFGLIVSIGFLLLVSLVVSAGLAALGTWWGAWFGGWVIALQLVNQVVSLLFVTALFALMYRILPSVRVGWQDVWYGAVATAVLFTIGKFAIGMYLGKAGVSSGFGAAGSIVVLLVWVFYSAQIFLLGAEFTWLYAHNHGSRIGKAALQETAPVESEPRALPPAAAPAPPSAERRPAAAGAREFATAGMVWIGFGAMRSVLSRRTKAGA